MPKTRFKLEHKAIAAVVLGNALEFYDFTIYVFFAAQIGEAFFPSANPADSLLKSLTLFGIGYVMRPVGGMLIGALADRAGRKPAMLLTLSLMAIGMLMLALTPSYATLGRTSQVIVVIGRLIQGLALGGEVGPSTAFLLEAAKPSRRAFMASWQIASQGCASLFAGLVALGLTYMLGEPAMHAWGWRVMFLLGISIVPVGFIIRRHLPETAERAEDSVTAGSLFSVLKNLVKNHGRMLLLTFVVIAASTVSNSIGSNMPVYAKTTLSLSETVSAGVPIALGTSGILWALFGGWLSDRIGRRPVLIWPRAAITIIAIPVFYELVQHPSGINVQLATFLMSALSSINAAAIIAGVPESLPRHLRSIGLSIVYALSVSIFGGSTNFVVNKLIIVTGDKLIPAYYLVGFSMCATLAALMLPETKGKKL